MGFSLFGSNTAESADSGNFWSRLTSLEGLERVLVNSELNPQIIFKHSTRCGISRVVLKNFEADWRIEDQKENLHLLDLIQFREVSNRIADLTGVQHQSPQVIYLQNRIATLHRSHQSIDAQEIMDLLKR